MKTGVFERESGKAISDAYDKRLLGDYGVGLTVSAEEARDLLGTAHDFIDRASRHVENR